MNDTTERELPTPSRAVGPAGLQTRGRDAEGLAEVDMLPSARPRAIGPGRKERAYQDRIAAAERELETARLLERGSNRMIDRLERESAEARRMERRLSFALGALQAQNLALQARLDALATVETPTSRRLER